jgi:phytanoyl-CoA hydroxylase
MSEPDFPAILREKFRRDGFSVLPGFLDQSEMRRLEDSLQRFLDEIIPTLPVEDAYYEVGAQVKVVKQVQGLDRYDQCFAQLFHDSRIKQLAATLLEDEVVDKNLQYFCKPPKIGKATPAHQDGFYFMLQPCEAVTMWLALDAIDESNGCIRYVRGSHRRGMRLHRRTTTLGFSQGIPDYPQPQDEANEVPIHAAPGDLLVHHALTIHRAEANRSENRPRRALGFVYYARSAQEDTAAQAAYQSKLRSEIATERSFA